MKKLETVCHKCGAEIDPGRAAAVMAAQRDPEVARRVARENGKLGGRPPGGRRKSRFRSGPGALKLKSQREAKDEGGEVSKSLAFGEVF